MRQFIKRFGGITLSTALVLSFLLIPDLAHAEAIGSNDPLKNFSEIAATLVHIITAAAMLMIQFFPPLWGSEFITGDQVTEMLRPMWIYIRNLTNIAFVGVILFLAFSNLVTSGKGIKEWNIKSKLGPVILGLVAINFSMLAVRVMVDVVHVGTVALLSIADPVIEARGVNNVADYYSRKIDTETFEDCEDGGGTNCKSVRELVNNTFCPSQNGGTGSCLFQIKEIEKIRADAEKMNNPEKKNIMLAFGSFFMKLESLPLLSADTGGLLDVLDSAIFSLVFGLAYLLALAAMMIVLLLRVVMMWVFIIFSPLLVAGWVMGIGGTGKVSEEFTKYLLVPLKAAAALAFGFVMIAQLQLMTIPSEFFVSVIEPGASLKSLWGPNEFGGWRMLWSIMTVVLFWKVVFDFALTGIPGAEMVKSFGEGMGKLALSTAGEIPIPGAKINGQTQSINDGLNYLRPSTLNRFATNMRTMPGGGMTGIKEAWATTLGGQRASDNLTKNADRTQAQIRNELRAGKVTSEQLLRNIQMQKDIFATLRPGEKSRLGTTNEAAFLKRMAQDPTFREGFTKPASAPETPTTPTETPTATTPPVTVDSSTGNITINNAGSPVTVNAAGTNQAEVLNSLRPTLPNLNDTNLDEILTILKAQSSDIWSGVKDGTELRDLLEKPATTS